jgi:hypothetical protein
MRLSLKLELPRPLSLCGAARIAGQAAAELPLAQLSDSRQRKQMSRPARLAALVLAQVLEIAGWRDERETIGAFLGVGGSGADLSELTALLASSVTDGRFSLQRFGERGLNAANPLLAFQLMNNFTLCHGAIQCGLGGPSGAFFSRGAGTVEAIGAAAWAILDGECDRAVAGGADSALHPVTLAELRRTGALAAGLHPDEGAAAVAITGSADPADDGGASVELFACGVVPGDAIAATREPSLIASLDPAHLERALALALASGAVESSDVVLTTAAVAPLRRLLTAELGRLLPRADHVELTSPELGETLAAAPALALCRAVDLLTAPGSQAVQVAVLSAGLDGDLGVFGLRRRRCQP